MVDRKNGKLLLLGYDSFHKGELSAIEKLSDYKLDYKFTVDEIKSRSLTYEDLSQLTSEIRTYIESSESSIAGISSYWDFPGTLLQAYLTDYYDLCGPTLESTLKCEHKYWSRLEQKKVIPRHEPDYLLFDPFNDTPEKLASMDLPYWIKPVKSCASQLSFFVEKREHETEIIEKIKKDINKVSAPIRFFLEQVERPDEISVESGNFCIVEHDMSGSQSTIEGYAQEGEIKTFALVDSVYDETDRSFGYYEYPSRVPQAVESQMSEVCKKFLSHIGYNNSSFNVEFLYDKDYNKLKLLEVNPRVSQSHTLPIEWVDGFFNLKVAFDLAMGRTPQIQHNKGMRKHAGKFFLRHYNDAKVIQAPDDNHFAKLVDNDPLARMNCPLERSMKLSDLKEQDSYSFNLADLYLSGNTRKEMLDRYKTVKNELNIILEDI